MLDTVRIGAFATNDLVLEGEAVSRFHAVIQRALDGDGFTISDIGGRIRLNGITISRAKLRQCDRIEIGDYQVVVASEQALGDWDGPSSSGWGDPIILLTKKKAV